MVFLGANASGRVRFRTRGEKGIDRLGVARRAQLGDHIGITQQASDARKGFQMVGAGVFGGKQQENDVDRLVIQRLEIHRRVEPGEDAGDSFTSASLPCGIAIPLPTPVEPRRSR